MSDSSAPRGDLVALADAHIGPDDPELGILRDFLASLPGQAATLVLLGDIFSLWLGAPKFTLPHHRAVLDACRELRRRGVRVVFVEGNREFSAAGWEGDAFDEVGEQTAVEAWRGRRWYLAHGDLLNQDDLGGRAFRRVARCGLARGLLGLLPARAGLSLGDFLERTLRRRGLRWKTAIPPERFARYAQWLIERGFDAGVIGHIHVELQFDWPSESGSPRSLFVLPDWRSTHRFLRIPAGSAPRFETWGGRAAAPPAVVAVDESARRASLRFERGADLAPGAPFAILVGHDAEIRRGIVESVDAHDPRSVVVAIEPGPPIRVGDRLVRDAAPEDSRERQ